MLPTVLPTVLPRWVVLVVALGLLAGVILQGSTLWHQPISMDNAELFEDFRSASWNQLFSYDRFSHLRPAKNLWFALLARHPDALPLARAFVVFACLVSAWLMNRLSRPLWPDLPLLPAALSVAWLVNPTTVSTVAWLATANYVFAGAGTLGFIALAMASMEPGASPPVHQSRAWAATLSLTIGALNHPGALLAGPLLLAYAPCVKALRGQTGPLLRRMALPYVLVVGLVVLLHVRAGAPPGGYPFTQLYPGWVLPFSSARYLFDNLALWLWPYGRFGVLLWDQPDKSLGLSAACIALLLGAGYYALWRKRHDRVLRFGVLWTLGFLLPVTNLVPFGNTPVALHYPYLAGWGLVIVLGRLAQSAVERFRGEGGAARMSAVLVVAALGVWLQPALAAAARWGDEVELFVTTMDNYPDNLRARVNLADVYIQEERLPEARRLLEASLRRFPQAPGLVGNYATILHMLEDHARLVAFVEANQAAQASSRVGFLYGQALAKTGQAERALAQFTSLLGGTLDREAHFAIGYQRATLLVQLGRHADAQAALQALLRHFPDHPDLLLTRQLIDRVLNARSHPPR